MSRLGREYLKVGELTELYFPSKGVRFIAVNDGVDSLVESSSDFNPIRNWANELHAKDTSRKVRSVKRMQAENGERLGGKPPYGYRKRDDDSKRLVPDEETKGVVQRIFKLCAEGKGPNQIARILRDDHVLNPTNQYYQQTGVACTRLDTTRPYNWCGATVANILSNPVYLGHTLNMQSSTLSYKNKQIFHRPPEEQVLVKNTHEVIIDQELWDTVQRVREHKRRPPKHMDAPGLFAGLVYCADCGGYMVLCRTGKMKLEQYYFRCSTYGKRGKDACTAHHITEANLNAIVLDDLRRVTHFARTKTHQFAAYINRKNTVQLRKENRDGTMYNLVGFQTNLKFGEQKRVFSMIPALKDADFVRYGVMHRNTYLRSPGMLDRYYRLIADDRIAFAGQMTGVEGYIESAASGFLAGIEMARRLEGKPPVDFPRETAIGALGLYISDTTVSDFQPMNVNFGIMPPLGYRIKGGKRVKNAQLAARSLEKIDAMREDVLSDRKGE